MHCLRPPLAIVEKISHSWTLWLQWLPGQHGVLSGRNMGPLGAEFNIDLTDDNALQLPTAHAGLLALPEPPSSIKDKVPDPVGVLVT